MYQFAVITPALFDRLMSHEVEIETLVRNVDEFAQYQLVRTTDGITCIAVCNDRPRAEASNLKVAAWIELNLPALLVATPVFTGGKQVAHFTA
jgi:hypothetical protein